MAVASWFSTGAALANPTGANVVHGTAAIQQAGSLLQITNSPNAIINWQSFSIAANEMLPTVMPALRGRAEAVNRLGQQARPATPPGTLEGREWGAGPGFPAA
jgi:hypothetical protein